MKELQDKTVIITGASRGLGERTARAFAQKGARVVVNYRSGKDNAEAVVQDINSNGGSAISVQADVSEKAGVNELFDQAVRHFGKIDIVVNNAGIMITKPLADFSEEEFDSQFSINVKSVFLVMKQAAEKMGSGGRIINISSSTSRLMMPAYAIYSATKAAVEQMTRVFAREIGSKGITVNAVLPGPLNTELFLKGKPAELINRIAGLSAFGRIGEVDDIVPVLLFLATQEAQWVTGQCFGVNGGMA